MNRYVLAAGAFALLTACGGGKERISTPIPTPGLKSPNNPFQGIVIEPTPTRLIVPTVTPKIEPTPTRTPVPIVAVPVKPEELPSLIKTATASALDKPSLEIKVEAGGEGVSILENKTTAIILPGVVIADYSGLKIPGVPQTFHNFLVDSRFNIPQRTDMISVTIVVGPSIETINGYNYALGQIDPLHLSQYFAVNAQTFKHDPPIRNINLISISDAIKKAMNLTGTNQSSLAHETSVELSFSWIKGMISMVNDGVPAKTKIDDNLLRQALRANPPFKLANSRKELEDFARSAPYKPGAPRILY